MILSNTLYDGFTGEMADLIYSALDNIPNEIDATVSFLPVLKLVLLLIAVFLALGILMRIFLGAGSGINRAVSCSFGILFLYFFTIVFYSLDPFGYSRFLSPLPFVSFHESFLTILPFSSSVFPLICTNFLSTMFLAFIVNTLDSLCPKGKSILSWFFLRLISVFTASFLNLALIWAERSFVPGLLGEYAPIALLGILCVFLLIGLSKVILGIVLSAVNPFIGAVYTFFFASFMGKQILKSIITASLITAFFYFLYSRGYYLLPIAPADLLTYTPLTCTMLLIWFFLGHAL